MKNKLYPIVKARLDEYDYMALLAGGCPDDEFEPEARLVAARIAADSTTEQIAQILAEVFSSQFSQPETAASFLGLAEKIRSDIHT